ncbi:MAG: pitrilysin family protein, partial [Pseudomonadota bacterium]
MKTPTRLFAFVLALALAACAGVPGGGDDVSAGRIEIERVVSPGGIEAWLVSEPAIPIIAVEAGFEGGAASDPEGQAGLTALMTATVTEGAGPYASEAFQRRLQELNMSLTASVGRDATLVSMRTLSRNRDAAFEMLRLAVSEPRFDEADVARVRDQLVVGLRRSEQSPRFIAGRTLWARMFPDHPYGRPVNGTPDTVAGLTQEAVAERHGAAFAKDALRIAVVGDIDAATLGPLLDETFGALPAASGLPTVSEAAATADGAIAVEPFSAPQSAILFAAPG